MSLTRYMNKVMGVSTYAILLPAALCLASCKKDEPTQPHVPTIQLSLEDVSCTEAWLKARNTEVPATIALMRDNQRVQILHLSTTESLFVDEGLLPKHPYIYQLQKLAPDSSAIETSVRVQVTTMDTSSGNWTFRIDTLGVTSSALYDCQMVSENDIWCVGELYLNDSSGQLDPILYNAAHWDGTQWNITRIPYIYQGSPTYSSIKTLFAFNEDDIWFANSTHWDGQFFHNVNLAISIFYGVSINKMWGNPTNGHLYVVGNSGTIAFSPDHGNTWQRVESGTTLPIRDIHGERENESMQHEVLCVADADGGIGGNKILSIVDGDAYQVSTDGLLSGSLWGIWFVPKRKYIAVGDGLWQAYSLSQTWQRATGLPAVFKTSITGQGLNDIAVCGAYWLLAHWNGATWHSYFPFASGSFTAVAMSGNRIVAVGGIGGKAIVARGTRQ